MNEENRYVIVTDVQMKFWSMVTFMVKWAIASLPALIILLVVAGLVGSMFAGLLAGLFIGSNGGGGGSSAP